MSDAPVGAAAVEDDSHEQQLPETTFHGRRWMIPGGTEDAHSVTLYVFVSDPYGDNVERHTVMLPLMAEGVNGLRVGVPQVDNDQIFYSHERAAAAGYGLREETP
jgi:hypothetical protein